MSRSIEAQLSTARLLLAQFEVQIAEFEGMNREARRTERGRDLIQRIDGLRTGHTKWSARITELESQLEPEQETP